MFADVSSRRRGVFFFFFITLEPRVERYKSLWALNTSPPRKEISRQLLGDVIRDVISSGQVFIMDTISHRNLELPSQIRLVASMPWEESCS